MSVLLHSGGLTMLPTPEVKVGLKSDGGEKMISAITLAADLPFTLQTATMESALLCVVPSGFVSDGMSVPRVLWRLLSPPIDPVTLAPSIIHDWLYTNAAKYGLDRADCDSWYCDALHEQGFPLWKCLLTYVGLRIFGGSHWKCKEVNVT